MLSEISRKWWMVLLSGVIAVVAGIMAIAWPGLTILLLVTFFGAFAIFDGISALMIGFRGADGSHWWEMILLGIVGIGAGLIAFFWPTITAFALLIIVAASAMTRGVFQIIAAIKLRKVIEGEWLLGLSGAISILFGIVLVMQPGAGLVVIAWMTGIYMITFGLVMIMLSLRLRGLSKRLGVARA